MSFKTRLTVSVTTASDGTATAYSDVCNGSIESVQYAKTDFADGVDFTITTESGSQNVWVDSNVNASETVYPMVATNGTDGAALSGAGTTMARIPVVNERVKIAIVQGGDTKSGTFYITVG
jgi:hypothetical protein